MIHYVFSVTNLINGKYYIGKHSTDVIHDRYLGSGMLLRLAVRKHGVENFERTILAFYQTSREAYDAEWELVTDEIVADPRSYNLTRGGVGNKDSYGRKTSHTEHLRSVLTGKKRTPEQKLRMSIAATGRKASDIARSRISASNCGRIHSQETKDKMSQARTAWHFARRSCSAK